MNSLTTSLIEFGKRNLTWEERIKNLDDLTDVWEKPLPSS